MIFAFWSSFFAQTNADNSKTVRNTAPSAKSNDDETQKRILDLEEQIKAMKEQIYKLTSLIQPDAKAHSKAAETENQAASSKPETSPAQTPSTAVQQKSLGVDVGSARLTPYGTIFFNAFGNSAGTNNADIPLFATPTGNSNIGASVRQTRLGVRLEGAKVGNARLNAVLEADFFGGFPSVGIGENFGVVRLRLANAKLNWEKTSVTVGQDWIVFAPVSPTSLAAGAIPQMAAAGNNWARLPQVKIERKLNDNFTWAGAILAPQTGDFSTNAAFFLQPTSGSSSNVPYFQSRIAFADNNWLGTKKSGSIGLSGHFGRSRVFTGVTNLKNDIESLGVAFDWNFPLAERLTFSGEAFLGRNLGGFQAGVFQGYNNDFAYRVGTILVPGGVRAIGTCGGWLQIGFTPKTLQNRLGVYGSFGIDDPRRRPRYTNTA